MKDIIASLRGTIPFFRQMMSEEKQNLEKMTYWLTTVAGLYKTEKEMIRPAIMLILESENPTLPNYDPVGRAMSENFSGYRPEGLLQQWAAQRNATLAVLTSLSDYQLSRTGVAADGKTVTLAYFVSQWAEEELKIVTSIGEA